MSQNATAALPQSWFLKRRAAAAGIRPKEIAQLSGHSLRAGYATAAAAAGVEERKIANVTRHKNITVLRGYIRRATAYDDATWPDQTRPQFARYARLRTISFESGAALRVGPVT